MATTNPSLKRSPGQIYRWRTWKKKWFFYITHLKCWRTTENTNLVAFCPWDYWTLLQGDFLKSLVISSFPAQYRKGILSSLFVLTGYHHHLVKVLLGENWLRQSGTRIWSECKKLKETCFSWILNIAPVEEALENACDRVEVCVVLQIGERIFAVDEDLLKGIDIALEWYNVVRQCSSIKGSFFMVKF